MVQAYRAGASRWSIESHSDFLRCSVRVGGERSVRVAARESCRGNAVGSNARRPWGSCTIATEPAAAVSRAATKEGLPTSGASERRVSKAPTEDSEDDDEVPYVPAGAPLNETLKALDEQLPPGPSVEALMASKSDDVELASEVRDVVKAPSPASSPGSFRDDRSWIRDDDAAAEVVDATESPPAPADRSAHEERARSHVSALVEAVRPPRPCITRRRRRGSCRVAS